MNDASNAVTTTHPRSTRPASGDPLALRAGLLAVLLTVLPAALLVAPGPAGAQEATPPATGSTGSSADSIDSTAPEPVRATRDLPAAGFYVGPATCGGDTCHGSTRPRNVFPVLQNEYYTWLREDPHAGAYRSLQSADARRMAETLGLAEPAWASSACLSCHALAVPEARVRGSVELVDGVSCESCHGPASGWRSAHTAADWSHADSVAAGMVDLRDPAVRARTCLDCHLGGPGRLVGHDLIAAGHPALRFELANYAASMPPHWRPWSQRQASARSARKGDGAAAWAAGQAQALRRSTAEVARLARSGPWPDFRFLDCASCHHSLAEERWRTQPASGGLRDRVGLPPWSPAPWVTLRPLVERLDADALAALEADVDTLARQLSRITTPASEVAATAERLEGRLATIAPRLDRLEWTRATTGATLEAVLEERRLAAADAASAEQVALAAWTLTGELLARDPRAVDPALVDALTRLVADLQASPTRFDRDRFLALLDRLDREVSR